MNAVPIIKPLGDTALTIHFGNRINNEISDTVFSLFQTLKQKEIPGIIDIIPAYASLTIVYDITEIRKYSASKTAFNHIENIIQELLLSKHNDYLINNRIVEIPVCYHPSVGIDIEEISSFINRSIEELIYLHCNKIYRVYMIGFLPGFPYMGSIDEKLSMPRKKTPRANVSAGSVGIAGLQTGIYSLHSPGGWNIIGKTPVKLFQSNRQNPCLLQAGDHVQFIPISMTEFNRLKHS